MDDELFENSWQCFVKALTFKTITNTNPHIFEDLFQFLAKQFPLVFSNLIIHRFGNTTLFEWPVSLEDNDSSELPILFISHVDVVSANSKEWSFDPFGGIVCDDYVYGRGAADNKHVVVGLLEVFEQLLTDDFFPSRTIYFIASDSGEEHCSFSSEYNGCSLVANWMKENDIKFEAIFEEGYIIFSGGLGMCDSHIGIVGVAENGYCEVVLTANDDDSISDISKATTAIIDHHVALKITTPLLNFFEELAPFVNCPVLQIFFRSFRYISPLVPTMLWDLHPEISAFMRNSLSCPFSSSSQQHCSHICAGPDIEEKESKTKKPNKNTSELYYSTIPEQKTEDLLNEIRKIVEPYNVDVSASARSYEPPAITSHTSYLYKQLKLTIEETFPNTVVIPGPVAGFTDSHYFEANHVFRFTPTTMDNYSEYVHRLHGADERMSKKNYRQILRFYYSLVQRVAPPSI